MKSEILTAAVAWGITGGIGQLLLSWFDMANGFLWFGLLLGGTAQAIISHCRYKELQYKTGTEIGNSLYAKACELTEIAEGESLIASQAYFGKAQAYRELASRATSEGWVRTL